MNWNWQSIVLLIFIGVAFFVALRAIIVGKKGRCGERKSGEACNGCPLSDSCQRNMSGNSSKDNRKRKYKRL